MPKMLASWIIVSYNTREATLQCLASLCAHKPAIDQEVILVDNNSSDGTAEAVEMQHPDVTLIRSETNLGFARGCNVGLANARGGILIFLNPDTIVHPGALDALVNIFAEQPEVGIAGGRLLNADGSLQWSQRRFPTLLRQLSEAFYLHFLFPKHQWSGEINKDIESYCTLTYPDWVSGAFLAIRREVLDAIGALDEQYFMYFEDMDWCFRCRKAGWQVAFVPEAKATHLGELSSCQHFEEFYPRLVRSRLRFARKHFGPFLRGASRILLCIVLSQRILTFVFTVPFLSARKYSVKTLFISRWKGLLAAVAGRDR